MTTVAFTHSVNTNGQLLLTLSSPDLPASFEISISVSYNSQSVRYSQTRFEGSSASSISAGAFNGTGTITVQGTLSPAGAGTFATFLFDAAGAGTFDANITSFTINGAQPVFTDPAPYQYTLPLTLTETLDLTQDTATSGSFNPYNAFSPQSSVKVQAEHGTVKFGSIFNTAEWQYTPEPGFYGRDTFTITSSHGGVTKDKVIVLDISPRGTPNADTFHSSVANYEVDGGAAIDTLVYQGASSNFTITKDVYGFIVVDKTGAEGTNRLNNVERLQFSDTTIALDVDGNAGSAYRLYEAAFNRTPDGAGLAFWINALDNGVSLIDVARDFIASSEFAAAYGSDLTNEQLVARFYQNILNREGDADGATFWLGMLEQGVARADVLLAISQSPENTDGLAAIIGNGFPFPGTGG